MEDQRMGALASTRPVGTHPKVPGPAAVELDRYGRDPKSPPESLRRLSNFKAGSGYAPFFAAWLADLPRLSSGHVFDMFILSVCVLSLGRPDNPRGKARHEWTKPISLEDLA